jgi:hypothetical protein
VIGNLSLTRWASFRFVDVDLVLTDQIPDNDESDQDPFDHGVIPMAYDLIDYTLPAHDPNFPKPRGLLPLPPEVAEQVASEEARIEREHGFRIAPDARQRMLDNRTLHYYYDGAYIAYRHTPQGVEVLGVGWDEARKYLDDRSPDYQPDIRVGTV